MGQGFENWTITQIAEHNARVAASKKKYAGAPVPASLTVTGVATPAPPQTPARVQLAISPPTDVAKLNKTEKQFYNLLKLQDHQRIYVQEITLKLADQTRYTCDFIVLTRDGRLVGYEVKGFMRDDAWAKLKIAARQYLFIRFICVRKSKDAWTYQDINP